MPSLGPEGLPLVALEAMAHSLPCLFSDLPVHREIAQDARAALLFRSGDVADLRAKLTELVANGSRRAEYGRYAHQTIRSKYNASIARQAYLDLFDRADEYRTDLR
jgi:glycosyltransferase involved in cell wall biosynthesis